MKKQLDTLTLADLQSQYEAFCENVRSVRQNTYWRTAFNHNGEISEEK